jgi:hypothetical protein
LGDFEVIMEGGQPAADDRRYRILGVKRVSTLEQELQQAGTEGFALLHSARAGVLLERQAGDAPPREYRMVATSLSGTAVRELDEFGSQGFRIVDVVPGGDEWAFALERKPGAKERYQYRFERLASEEQFDAQASAAERDGFQLYRVIERLVLFARAVGAS